MIRRNPRSARLLHRQLGVSVYVFVECLQFRKHFVEIYKDRCRPFSMRHVRLLCATHLILIGYCGAYVEACTV